MTDAAPAATLAELVLTQWMAAFLYFEALAAEFDRKGRLLPLLGV